MFPQLFRVLPNSHECLYNSIETRSTCFLFLLENNATRKRKTTKKENSLLTSSLRQQRALILCLHRVIQTRFLTNQRTCLGLFSKHTFRQGGPFSTRLVSIGALSKQLWIHEAIAADYLTIVSFRLDYEYEIEYEYDFTILVFRLHIITTHTNFIP